VTGQSPASETEPAAPSATVPSRARARRARRARTWRRRSGVAVLCAGVVLMGVGVTMVLGEEDTPDPVDVQGEFEVRDPSSTTTVVEPTRNTLERDSIDDPVVAPSTPDPGGTGDPAQVEPTTTTMVAPAGEIDASSPPVSVL